MQLISQLLWAVAPGIIVGVVMAAWNRQQKAKDEKDRQADAERVKGEALKLSLLVATAQLSYATTMALKRGSTNGEVEPAVEQYNAAMKEFRNYEREQIARSAIDN